MVSPTEALLNFVAQVRFEDLPKGVVNQTKLLILDSVGISVAAIKTQKGTYGIELARRFGGPPEAGVLGTRDRVSATAAAFANGELMNALDWDAFPFPTHSPPIVIPSQLTLGEASGASGKQMILAAAVGFELSRRLGIAIRGQRLVFDREEGSEVGKIAGTKYAVSAIACPVIAAAAGAAKFKNFDREKLSNVVGLAAHFSPFPQAKWKKEPIGAMTKYICCGWASLAVAAATQLADMGYTADTTVLDGDLGYWRCFGGDKWDPDALIEGLGQEWRFPPLVEYKPYPCCAFYAVFLDCFNKIAEDNNLNPEDIQEVRIKSGPWPVPPPSWGKVKSHIHAQFHPQYLIACSAFRISRADWQDEETMRNPEIEKFMDRVSLKLDPHPDSKKVADREPGANMTIVEVLAKGRTFREEGKYTKLASTRALSHLTPDDLVKKFRSNASKVLPKDKTEKAITNLLELENVEVISEVLKQVTL